MESTVADDERTLAERREQDIAGIAHELRTPLTAVIGVLDSVMGDDQRLDGELHDALKTAHHEAVEMGRRLDDFLAAARMSADAITVTDREFMLADVIDSALDGIAVPETIDVQLDGVNTACCADPVYVRQIVRSLLMNAVRFAATRVSVAAVAQGDTAVVDIANDGPPIPHDQLDDLFEPFARSRSRGREGALGLGLATARQLAAKMDGDLIHFQRDRDVVFRLTLPAPDDGGQSIRTPIVGIVRLEHQPGAHPALEPVVDVNDAHIAAYRQDAGGQLAVAVGSAPDIVAAIPPGALLFVSARRHADPLPDDLDPDRVVVEMHLRYEADVEVATRLRDRGFLIAAHLEDRLVESMPPDHLVVDARTLVDIHGHADPAEIDRVAGVGRELDARLVAADVTTADQLMAVQDAGIPLARGRFIGVPSDQEPTVTEAARRTLLRSASEWHSAETLAAMLQTPAPLRAVPDASMTARAGDLVSETLRRAMARPRPQRLDGIRVTDAFGNLLRVFEVEELVAWLADAATPATSGDA